MTDRATPNLPARDLGATREFYATLGFAPRYADDGWLILTRGELQLEFFPYPDLDPATSSAPFVAGTHVQPFGNAPVFPVASPDYLRKLAPIRTLRDLLDHSLIQERDSANWGSWFAKQGVTPLAEIHGPRLWHGPSYSRCSKAGLRHRTG